MEEQFNRSDLVSFGTYLLSDERTNLITNGSSEGVDINERLKNVYHADIERCRKKIEIMVNHKEWQQNKPEPEA